MSKVAPQVLSKVVVGDNQSSADVVLVKLGVTVRLIDWIVLDGHWLPSEATAIIGQLYWVAGGMPSMFLSPWSQMLKSLSFITK